MLSYNIWEDYRLLGMNFNELTEALYDKLFLPMAGLLVALFTGWFMHPITVQMSCGTTPVVRTLARAHPIRRRTGRGRYSHHRTDLTVMLMTITDWLWSYVLIGALLIVGPFHDWLPVCADPLVSPHSGSVVGYRVAGFERGFQLSGLGGERRRPGWRRQYCGCRGRDYAGRPGRTVLDVADRLVRHVDQSVRMRASAALQATPRRGNVPRWPAYVMRYGLGWRVLPVIYSVLLLVTIGFGFNAVQSYVVTTSIESAFGVPALTSGLVMTAIMAVILFGGIRRLRWSPKSLCRRWWWATSCSRWWFWR